MAHEKAFGYIGGVPNEIVYDQDKVFIVSENGGDIRQYLYSKWNSLKISPKGCNSHHTYNRIVVQIIQPYYLLLLLRFPAVQPYLLKLTWLLKICVALMRIIYTQSLLLRKSNYEKNHLVIFVDCYFFSSQKSDGPR